MGKEEEDVRIVGVAEVVREEARVGDVLTEIVTLFTRDNRWWNNMK